MKQSIFLSSLLIILMIGTSYGQDTNVQIGLNSPAYGVKIKNNFPTGSGYFSRGFTLSNHDASVEFVGLGAYGSHNNGISTLIYTFIGPSYHQPFMTFKPNGNIGIGTVAPGDKLSVNGKIRAKEIKVEVANWPDYVFGGDYKLPTLRETEQHIKKKGHLEGIPSAKEVKANGIDLGEMNAKLLQKIEELTLHLIDLKKIVDKQSQILINQQKYINQIEKLK